MLSVNVTRKEAHGIDRLTDLIEPGNSEVPKLGVVGVTVTAKNEALFPDLRAACGVYVAAWSAPSGAEVAGLQIGDVIHDLNGAAVSTVEELRRLADGLKPGGSAALLVERERKLMYVAFLIE
jgi:serine protease Do